MALIEIRAVDKSFGSVDVLRSVSLSIGEREFVTFLGPSGCGKTTMLRIIAGFLTPDRGEIRVDGAVLSSAGSAVPPERRRMGMVFQNYAVWPHMTVAENVGFGLKIAGVEKRERVDRVARILSAVGLDGYGDRRPQQLSGGQQQRVALARSLVVEPAIILLDEPLSNLDAKLREKMRVELKVLQRRTGITFVYVTHDQAEAMAMSDRVAVFQAGTLQQCAPPREIYERPANLFVAEFMGGLNRLQVEVVGSEGGRTVVRLAGHQLKAVARTAGVPASGVATLAVRPEAIGIDLPASGSELNQIDGTITALTFLGNFIDYDVDVAGQAVRVQADRWRTREVGSRVRLQIPVEECIVIGR
ncbi:MAG TPA: ABC transporter ATP-binding protein [Geminicoccaceae bacterium]|nr:ABC transporter ATP-binding protein [Geminicoccus sp.]HMU49446.1 ABC transporter ATP-binding protein [Geminicoccaceae bacterium]